MDLNDNNDDETEVFSTSSLDSDTIDLEESGYIMKPNEDHRSIIFESSEESLSSESIDSSPNSYMNEPWSGYKVNSV